VSFSGVGRVEPLFRGKVATVVRAGLVLAPALRLERDAGVAGGGEQSSVPAGEVTAVSKRLPTGRASWIEEVRCLAHEYRLDLVEGRDHAVCDPKIRPWDGVGGVAFAR
jgi:hypothetical protein